MIPRSRVDSKSALLWTPLPLSWSLCPVGEIQHPGQPSSDSTNSQQEYGQSELILAILSNQIMRASWIRPIVTGWGWTNIATGGPYIITKIKSRLRTKFLKPKKLILNGACGGETDRNSAIKSCCVIMPLFSPEGPARCITIHDNRKERRKACSSVQSKAGCQWIHDVALYNCS
jgi:hypothetical protein